MQYIKFPDKTHWQELLIRPQIKSKDLDQKIDAILKEVKENGDQALKAFTKEFDHISLDSLQVSEAEIKQAEDKLSPSLKEAIEVAYQNIAAFHRSQIPTKKIIETTKGVFCWRENRPIEKVGLYIPGGSAPLFSTILMLGIPAKIAGCKEIVLCSPVNENAEIHPAILYSANKVGISRIYKVGGAQAIAAMAFGTESIPAVYKILGPGNQYVTKAKEKIQQWGVAIDMPAGPSEVLVIADNNAHPSFIAADLLSQAEHGADSQVVLLSNDESIILETLKEIDLQVPLLDRKETILLALQNSKAILLNSLEECLDFSNLYAPEHLILNLENPESFIPSIINAGSVFLGKYSCESAGDYASGTNHTLPTNGFAKSYSGVSLDSFVKKISFQEVQANGLKILGPVIEKMAETENLMAHKNAVSIRLKEINKDGNKTVGS